MNDMDINLFPLKPGLFLTHRPRHWRESARERNKSSRIYVGVENETVLDNLVNRTSRPHREWGKLIRSEIMPILFPDSKLTWSQKAGCTCPCSPGFVINGHYAVRGDTEVGRTYQGNAEDFFLTIDFAALDIPSVVDGDERTHRARHFGATV